jgi:Fur family ferric uptake transcriptional regulator
MGDAMMAGLINKCLKNGIRITSQCQVIIEVIEESEDHPDVDQLYQRAVEQDRTISIATVYWTVKLLEEMGYELVDHRLELFGRKLRP